MWGFLLCASGAGRLPPEASGLEYRGTKGQVVPKSCQLLGAGGSRVPAPWVQVVAGVPLFQMEISGQLSEEPPSLWHFRNLVCLKAAQLMGEVPMGRRRQEGQDFSDASGWQGALSPLDSWIQQTCQDSPHLFP